MEINLQEGMFHFTGYLCTTCTPQFASKSPPTRRRYVGGNTLWFFAQHN